MGVLEGDKKDQVQLSKLNNGDLGDFKNGVTKGLLFYVNGETFDDIFCLILKWPLKNNEIIPGIRVVDRSPDPGMTLLKYRK